MNPFTHIDNNGDAVMVDVSGKVVTARTAVACGRISMSRECYEAVRAGAVKKGDVLGVARLAGIMGAKRTSDLIPLCHPLPLTRVAVDFELDDALPGVQCHVTAETVGRTGVEMEAMTAVSVALLTIYDMLKAADRAMEMGAIRLLEKKGGKSGHWRAGAEA